MSKVAHGAEAIKETGIVHLTNYGRSPAMALSQVSKSICSDGVGPLWSRASKTR